MQPSDARELKIELTIRTLRMRLRRYEFTCELRDLTWAEFFDKAGVGY